MKHKTQVSSTEVEQAIQQVLQAERDAEHAIHDCENGARQTIRDAQVSAQRIHNRANQRITNMEMRHGHKLDQLIKDIDREAAVALNQGARPYCDEKRLCSIAEKLAVELCRNESTSGGDTETGQ